VTSFFRNQFPLLCWLGLIFWLSSIPRVPQIPVIPFLDKIAHASVFFVLCWFGHRAFNLQDRFPLLRRHALSAAFLLSAVYGVTDELHQRFVPGRSYDPLDMVADASGAALYILLYWWTTRKTARPATVSREDGPQS
jgi:VanZ family protein